MGFLDFITDPIEDVIDWGLDLVGDVVDWFIDIPDVPKADEAQKGTLLNKQSNLAQIPVIYGERRIGGTRVFVETSGSDNTYLYIALVLCEGEVYEIGDVYINDVISTDSKFNGLVQIDRMTGADNQAASTVLTAAPSWTTDHTLSGVAYLGLRFTWDRDVFGSIPNVTAVVKGRKVVKPWTSDAAAYSDNPVLCLYDYLTNTRYGKGLPSSVFDASTTSGSWYTAWDFCEAQVSGYDGASQIDTYDCNAVLDVSKPIIDNVKTLLSGMQGLLSYSQGIYRITIERNGTAGYSFTEDNILSNIAVNGAKKRDRFNRIIATFTNPEKNWQADQIEFPPPDYVDPDDSPNYLYDNLLAEDGGVELEKRISLDTITNPYQARNIAYTALYKSRDAALRCSFVATIDALQVAVGDIVSLTHSSLGWSSKPFRVSGLTLRADGNVNVALSEHQNSIYFWLEGSQVPTYSGTTLPDPFSVPAVTESTITVASSEAINDNGSSTQRFKISWTDLSDSFISEYIVQITEDGTTDWDIEARAESSPVMISGIKSGSDYNVRIKAVNASGISSGWVYLQDEASTTETACNTAGNTWDATLGVCLIPVTAANLTTEAGGGGNTTYYQDNAPTSGMSEGDLWIDTNDSNKIYRWDGTSTWNSVTGAIASANSITENEISLTNNKLADIETDLGAITAGSLNIGSGKFQVDASGNVTIKSSTSTGVNRLEITSTTIKVIDSSDVVRVQIGDLS